MFISFIEGEAGRSDAVRELLQRGADGEIELLTSTFTIAEVAYLKSERDGRMASPEIEARIDALWGRGSPVRLVVLTAEIAMLAKRLMRECMTARLKLQGKDAVHLATAVFCGAGAFATFDDFRGNAAGVGRVAGLRVAGA
jgi:predicted nucleic acid-binding protein